LRGVEVHNLKAIDLDLPRQKLIVLCGLSGSGKSSLALDTLYAEGQRRYIESFSAYTRQFLQRLEKPDAERIDGIPPAIAVTGQNTSRSSRSTVGTATETSDYLRLLFAKIGHVFCLECGQEVRCDSPQTAAELLAELPQGTRYMIVFPLELPPENNLPQTFASLKEEGFIRVIAQGQTINLTDAASDFVGGDSVGAPVGGDSVGAPVGGDSVGDDTEGPPTPETPANHTNPYVVVDRLTAGEASENRLRDSLEIAFTKGHGRCCALVADGRTPVPRPSSEGRGILCRIDGRPWRRIGFSRQLACEDCAREYHVPEPRLYSFNSPLGACPACEGFGNVIGIDMDLVVPDPSKTLREGAVAPWNSPAYAHELEELLALADDYDLPVDVPFAELTERHRELILHGVPERDFGGLDGFFEWLKRRKYKMHIRVFLSRWRSYRPCPQCRGTRLRPEALATRIGGKNIAEISAMKVCDAAEFFRRLELSDWERNVGRMMLDQVRARLAYLEAVGLGYLTLDRTLRTISGGEARRVALTSALGSSLVNMLYVLDEPSIGLHPRDVRQLIDAIVRLRDRNNTVVVVEHEEAIIRAADQVVERGGRIVFQGTPEEMERSPESLTGDYLARRRGLGSNDRRRPPNHGWIRLAGARGNNLQNITVEFPLGVLCLVTGVSGSGKSTLVQDTLYPALCRRLRKDAPKPYDYDDVYGDGQIDDVIMIDQSPIGRSPRSNPVTYLKAFDEIRAVFADTVEARTRNYTAGHFSFNVDGGRSAGGATRATATATFRSTCSSWPTSTCGAASAAERATATRSWT